VLSTSLVDDEELGWWQLTVTTVSVAGAAEAGAME
jgi:hypothetical protein